MTSCGHLKIAMTLSGQGTSFIALLGHSRRRASEGVWTPLELSWNSPIKCKLLMTSMLINSHLNNILLPQHSICHANLAQAVICGRSIDHVRNLFCAKFTAGRSIGTFTAASHSWDRSELLNLPQADCQSGKVIDWSERLLRAGFAFNIETYLSSPRNHTQVYVRLCRSIVNRPKVHQAPERNEKRL